MNNYAYIVNECKKAFYGKWEEQAIKACISRLPLLSHEELVNLLSSRWLTKKDEVRKEVFKMLFKEQIGQHEQMIATSIFEKDGKRGFYNLNTNKVLVPATYTHAWFFSEGLAAVEKDGKIGFINMKGALVIPHQFVHRTNDRPDIVFKDGRCVMANGNGQMGVIDRKGEWVVKPQYEKVDLTESGIFATTSNSKLLLSNKGEIIQDDLIVKVEPLTCNVQLKEKDAEGRWRLQDVEMKMDYYVYYTFANSDRCGLMDKDGNRLTEPVYSKIEALNEHLFSFYLLDGETQFVKSL